MDPTSANPRPECPRAGRIDPWECPLMDQLASPRPGDARGRASDEVGVEQDRIDDILDRSRKLTDDELVRLSRAYVEASDPSTAPGGIDRRRAVMIARSRAADRTVALDALEVRVAEVVRDAGSPGARRALRRLGILEHAERAIADAVLAIALRDRLGEAVAHELARPFESIR